MRGIGSLMRGRNVFSLIQALREGYELLPEEYQVLDEAFQYLKGTQFSIDKPGIESFKELLGISPEDLGETPSETIPLPGPPQETDKPPFSEGPLTEDTVDAAYNQYLRNLHPAQRDPDLLPQVVENPDLAKILQSKDVMNDVLDSFLNAANTPENRDLKILPSKEKGELYRKLALDYDSASTSAELILDRSWYKDYGLLAPPMTYEEFLKRRYGKDLVDIMVPEPSPTQTADEPPSKDQPPSSDRPAMADKPRPKAAGGFIDKPLYDDRRMIG
jgi:hypothetical protein